MTRPMTLVLDQINLGNTDTRRPDWQVLVYDVRSGLNTISEVVRGVSLNATTGPLDISTMVGPLAFKEAAGDYITQGIPSFTCDGSMIDENGLFDPKLVIGDATALGRFFRKGNIIKVIVGDLAVDRSSWVGTFFGRFSGQPGYQRGRVQKKSLITFKAFGRETTFIPFERTTEDFPFGTTFLAMVKSVAENEMGLDVDETILSGFGTNTTRQNSTQIANNAPMTMLAKLMLVDGLLPVFDGDGKLTQTSGLVTGIPDRFYDTDRAFKAINQPNVDVQPPDAVKVIGLDFNLTRIDQPLQLIAEFNVTTGYFTSNEDFEIYWTSDRTALVDAIQVAVVKSVNGGMSPLGGGEDFTFIATPTESALDTPVGTVGVRITIDTGYAPWVAVFLLVIYVVLSVIPDLFVGVFSGVTIAIGRVIQAISLVAAMLIMTKLGRGQYQFYGEPFEYVFGQLPERAIVDGVNVFERNEVLVQNHLLDNRTDIREVAKQLMLRQQARGRPREVEMIWDLGLQPDDTYQHLSTENLDRKFLVDTISYVLERGKTPMAKLLVYEITDNIARAT